MPEGWMSAPSINSALSRWAEAALSQIADGGAVSICISLLVRAHVPSIQELTLSLLASIASISDEAAAQFFLPPNSFARQGKSSSNRRLNETTTTEGGTMVATMRKTHGK